MTTPYKAVRRYLCGVVFVFIKEWHISAAEYAKIIVHINKLFINLLIYSLNLFFERHIFVDKALNMLYN